MSVALSRFNTELPPAYKDVVQMETILADTDTNVDDSATTANDYLLPPPPLPPLPPSIGGGSPTMPPIPPTPRGGGDDAGDDVPPPPTYQEVIALSPSAADMHQRIRASQREGGGEIA